MIKMKKLNDHSSKYETDKTEILHSYLSSSLTGKKNRLHRSGDSEHMRTAYYIFKQPRCLKSMIAIVFVNSSIFYFDRPMVFFCLCYNRITAAQNYYLM